MDLKELRNKINEIDEELLSLYLKRMDISKQIGQYKKEHNLPIYDSKREEELINNLLNKINNNELKDNYKKILLLILDESKKQQKNGLVTVVGTKKNHFMSDTKWLLQHGFKEIEKLPNGFSLLVMSFHENSAVPYFNDCVKSGECPDKLGIVAYYSNRCPYTDYYVNGVLRVLAQEINIPLKVIKLETREQAQNSPTPATIFSLFYNGKFVTTDLSICTESKFTKLLK